MILTRIIAAIETAATIIAAASLALVALLTAGAVCLRAAGLNLPDALDLSSLFMAVAVFWGMVSAVRQRALIQVDFVVGSLPSWLRTGLNLFALVAIAIAFVLIARAGLNQIVLTLHSGEVTPELRLPLWPLLALALSGVMVTSLVALALLATRCRSEPVARPQQTELTHGE